MADETVESLTVDIGLTSEEFQAGVEKILGAMGQMQSTAEETGEGMSSSFAAAGRSVGNLALKFTGLFLAVRGIEDVVGYFKNLSVELGNLGFAGEYLGQSSVELSRFGEVAKLAGGHASDAIAAVQSLQSSIFGLEFQGQMSQNLLMLQRLGVGYLTAAGQMKPLKDIAMDTASALQRQLPGKANEAMRVQWAAQIFGAGGLANAVGGGLAQLRKFYSESTHDQKSITQRTIDSQMHLQQSITRLSYDIRSEATKALDRLTPEIKNLIHVIRDQLIPTIDEIIVDISEWLHPGKMLANAAKKPLDITSPTSDVAHFISWFRHWESQHLSVSNPEIDHMQVPASVMARLPPGTNLQLLKMEHVVAGGDKGDPTWSKAIVSYIGHEGIPGAPPPKLPPIPHASHLSTPSAARPAAAGIAGKPTASITGPQISIGNVNVNAPNATDANGIAANIDRALRRKLLVAQADPGLA